MPRIDQEAEESAFEEAWADHPASRSGLGEQEEAGMKEFARAFWERGRKEIAGRYFEIVSEVRTLRKGEDAHDAAVRVVREREEIAKALAGK